jgi:hypothetical protein
MGLLDDAIREHLELKRRRGADPNELERLEREALGPVRRGPHDAYDAQPDEEQRTELAYRDEEPGAVWTEPQRESEFPEDDYDELDDDEVAQWEAPERGPVEGGIGVEPDTAAPATPAPPAAAPPPAFAEPPAAGSIREEDYLEQETVEHDVEGEEPEPAERSEHPGEDDMLEETPEFLQDTPDHDRLWFEQRPPRDFDLDG